MGRRQVRQHFLIESGVAVSNVVDMRSVEILAIDMPAAWTAANLTFLAAYSDPNAPGGPPLDDVYDASGAEVVVTAAADRYIVLSVDPSFEMGGVAYLQIRSGTSGVPVNQAADREIVLVCEPRV